MLGSVISCVGPVSYNECGSALLEFSVAGLLASQSYWTSSHVEYTVLLTLYEHEAGPYSVRQYFLL